MHIFKLTKTQLGIGGARFRYEVLDEAGKVLASFDDSRAYVACLVFRDDGGAFSVRHFTSKPERLTVRGLVILNENPIGVAFIETANYGRAITRFGNGEKETFGEPIDWAELPAWYLERLDLDLVPDTATPKKAVAAAAKESPAESLLRTLRERVGGSDAADDPAFIERLDGILRPYVAKTFLAETYRQYIEIYGRLATAEMIKDLEEIARAALKADEKADGAVSDLIFPGRKFG